MSQRSHLSWKVFFPTYVYSVNASSKDQTDQTFLLRISASAPSGEGKMRSIDTVGIFHARATSPRTFKSICAGEDRKVVGN